MPATPHWAQYCRTRPWAQMDAPPQPSTLHLLRFQPWGQMPAPPYSLQ